jgi:hypothetical protein
MDTASAGLRPATMLRLNNYKYCCMKRLQECYELNQLMMPSRPSIEWQPISESNILYWFDNEDTQKNKIILQIRDVKYVFNIIFDYSNMGSKTMSYLLLF